MAVVRAVVVASLCVLLMGLLVSSCGLPVDVELGELPTDPPVSVADVSPAPVDFVLFPDLACDLDLDGSPEDYSDTVIAATDDGLDVADGGDAGFTDVAFQQAWRPLLENGSRARDAIVPAGVACDGSSAYLWGTGGLYEVRSGDKTFLPFSLPQDVAGNQISRIVEPPAGNRAAQASSGRILAGLVNTTGSLGAAMLLCEKASRECVKRPAGLPATTGFGEGARDFVVTPGGAIVAGMAGKTPIYRSTDGGASFSPGGTGMTDFASVRRFQVSGGVIVAAANVSMWRSVDEGISFSRVTSGLPGSFSVGDLAARGGTLYAGVTTSSTPSLYRSLDGGASWVAAGGSLSPATQVRGVRATSRGVFVATNAGVFRSTDEGASFAPYNRNLFRSSVVKVATDGDTVFAGTFRNVRGLATSTDQGRTFAGTNDALRYKLVRAIWVQGTTVLGAGEDGIFRSVDRGATFAPLTGSGLPTNGPYVYAFAQTGTTLLAALNTGLVYRSTDAGATWASSSKGLPANAGGYSMAVQGGTVILGANSRVYRSTDAGVSWSAGGVPSPGQGGFLVYSLLVSGSSLLAGLYGFGSPDTHGLYRSTDVGMTWEPAQNGIPSNTPVNALAAAGSTLFAGVQKSGLFRSTDGGATWSLFERRLAPQPIFSLAATADRLYVGTGAHGLVSIPLAHRAWRLVPIVLDVDTGSAHYTTELALTNRGTSAVQATLQYTASIGSGSGSAVATLAAGQQLVIPDAIGYLRTGGVPIPTGASVGGTLLVTFTGPSSRDAVSVTARTTTATAAPQPAGAAGLAYSGVDPALLWNGKLTLFGLRSSAADRTNVAVYSASSVPVTLKVTAHSGDGSGASAVVASADELPAWGWKQYDGVLARAGFANGWVTVERVSAGGSFGAYAAINDNGTSDGSFVLPVGAEPRPPYLNVPALVETATFLSELVLTNASAKPATFRLSYRESLSPAGGAGGTASVTVAAGTQVIQPNAIAYLRSLGLTIGTAGGGASYAGSLHVEVAGADVSQTFAGARTAAQSPSTTQPGQFGLFTPAFYGGAEAADEAYVYGLRADAANRSNVAVVNTAVTPEIGSITLRLQAYDGDAGGVAAGAVESVTLGPGEWKQLGGFLAGKGVRNGWVRITRVSGTAPWIAYGAINDGGAPGERTGDGAYVPMSL